MSRRTTPEADALRFARLLLPDGAGHVVELRVITPDRGVCGGYYTDSEALAGKALELSRIKAGQIYVTVNPVGKAVDRLRIQPRRMNTYGRTRRFGDIDPGASDTDVAVRRWLLVDCDPVRPKGESATLEEVEAAMKRARAVFRFLRDQGFPDPIAAESGNGAHLLYRYDAPADDGEVHKRLLAALDRTLTDDVVKVDPDVCNASRIFRFYGTVNRKGPGTEDRPHRTAGLLNVPGDLGERVLTVEDVERATAALEAQCTPDEAEPLSAGPPRVGSPSHLRNSNGPDSTLLTLGEIWDLLSRLPVPPQIRGRGYWIRVYTHTIAFCEESGHTGHDARALMERWSPAWEKGDYPPNNRKLTKGHPGGFVKLLNEQGVDMSAWYRERLVSRSASESQRKPVPVASEVRDELDKSAVADPAGDAHFDSDRKDEKNEAADITEDAPTIPDEVYELVPKLFSEGAALFPTWYERDVFLTGLLGTLSAALPRVRISYAGTRYSPP